jgi:Acetoacetate decarboxylase (ADC)
MAAFTSACDLPVPADLRPLAGRRRLIVGLADYREGTLRYRELVVGTLVRRGARAGVLALGIWVDSPESMRGGRRLWGIPKELADFACDGELIRVHDAQGTIATLATGPARTMPIWPLRVPAVGFGQVDGERVFLPGRARGRPALGSLRVVDWSGRLPPLARTSGARRAFVLDPCSFLFPAGIRLGPAALAPQPPLARGSERSR